MPIAFTLTVDSMAGIDTDQLFAATHEIGGGRVTSTSDKYINWRNADDGVIDPDHLNAMYFSGQNFSFVGRGDLAGEITGISFRVNGVQVAHLDIDLTGSGSTGVLMSSALSLTPEVFLNAYSDYFAPFQVNGNQGDDRLSGTTRSDILDGRVGADTMIGGRGNDTYYVDDPNDQVLEASGEGTDIVYSTATYVLSASEFVENLTLQGTGSIDGTGNGLNNALTGNSGANTLIALAGSDTLDGGAGADSLVGGVGNDTYYVDNAGDRVVEKAGEGTDTVHTTLASYTLAANVERLYFDDTGGHVGKGNALSNLIAGNAGADRFVIDGGGNDTFSGGGDVDSFDARSGASGMTLRLDDQSLNAGSVAGDVFASIEKFFGSDTAGDRMTAGAGRANFYGYGGNDTLTGGSATDVLSGGAGNDSLVGNAGKDFLDGGIGNDTMTGGADADYFTFVDAAFGKDVITDFQDGLDKLKIFHAVADSFNDFTITGNGTDHVVLTLASAPANTITLDSAANITIAANDFLFY